MQTTYNLQFDSFWSARFSGIRYIGDVVRCHHRPFPRCPLVFSFLLLLGIEVLVEMTLPKAAPSPWTLCPFVPCHSD